MQVEVRIDGQTTRETAQLTCFEKIMHGCFTYPDRLMSEDMKQVLYPQSEAHGKHNEAQCCTVGIRAALDKPGKC